jgi:hypothetical protein
MPIERERTMRMRKFHIPMNLEEQMITKIYSLVSPQMSIGTLTSEKDAMYEDIAQAVWEYAQAKEEECKKDSVMQTLRQVADWDSEMGDAQDQRREDFNEEMRNT